jgi:CBS domain containing-hemolysin-like protein
MFVFDWVNDPQAWVGLATLIVLELVLGIDNLVFVSILAAKLPEHQRDRARLVGLGLALVMRIGLLSAIAWIVTLTQPLLNVGTLSFSGRDIIMVVGGLFLLFKGTMELHERLEGHHGGGKGGVTNALFWQVLVQIVLLDAVFSLDSIITAVGVVHSLPVMVAAVVISMGIMMLMSKPLMMFVSRHPTVVVLCLGFLMMIGMSLLAEGFGFHIEKGYMYAAIVFAVAIEAMNLFVRKSNVRIATTGDLRDKTAAAILGLLGGDRSDVALGDTADRVAEKVVEDGVFTEEEKDMVRGVLTLGESTVKSIMTPRTEIDWLDINSSEAVIAEALIDTVHSRMLVADGELENIVGVVHVKEMVVRLMRKETLDLRGCARKPLMVPETSDVMQLLDRLRVAPLQIAIVYDEHGSIEGILTPTDVLEAIAGEFPDEDESLSEVPQSEDGIWVFEGWTNITQVSNAVEVDLSDEAESYTTINGFVMGELGEQPVEGQVFETRGLKFEVLNMDKLVIGKIKIAKA